MPFGYRSRDALIVLAATAAGALTSVSALALELSPKCEAIKDPFAYAKCNLAEADKRIAAKNAQVKVLEAQGRAADVRFVKASEKLASEDKRGAVLDKEVACLLGVKTDYDAAVAAANGAPLAPAIKAELKRRRDGCEAS